MGARRMLKVSLGVWGLTVSQALLGLVTTPFLVHHLGASQYGIFAVIGIISTYLLNVELGFGHATLRFLARSRAAGDLEEEQHVLSTSLGVFLVAGVAATAIALIGSSFVVDHFVHGTVSDSVALKSVRIG